MGIHTSFLSFPYIADYFDRIKRDREFARDACYVFDFMERQEYLKGVFHDPESYHFAKHIAETHPGIGERYCCAGRNQIYISQLLFLISEEYRTAQNNLVLGPEYELFSKAAEGTENALLWNILTGGDDIADHVCGICHGYPIRYIMPKEIARAAAYLSRIQVEDLRKVFDDVISEGQNDIFYGADEWEIIESSFIGIKHVFTEALKHGEGVITIYD